MNTLTKPRPTAEISKTLLSLEGLRVSFSRGRIEAVKGVDLDIRRGEVVALVGESGSGKSVTAKALMGLTRYAGGTIAGGKATWRGADGQDVDLLGLSEHQLEQFRGNRIGMIFQEPMTSLNPVLTIGFQLTEAVIRHQGLSKADARRRALAALEQVRMPEPERRLSQYPHELSGGMRQRVMIGMALICRPDLLIADEPTTALDVTVQAEILGLIKTIQRETGMSVLFITHDMGVVAEIADQVAVMLHGEIIEQGPVAQVFDAPRHAYTRLLLDAAPKLGAGVAPGAAATVPHPEIAHDIPPALEVRGLRVRYPMRSGLLKRVTSELHAVEDVSFTLAPRETLAIVGESGCGKSTTAKAILRLIDADAGEILLDGKDILSLDHRAMKAARRGLQMVFQDPYASLNPRMRIMDILAEPFAIHKSLSTEETRLSIFELLDRVGLSREMANRYPHQFSGGQRQRIAIARALALRPRVIIADEPVSALDVSIQAQILDLLAEIQKDFDVALLFISHDMGVVERVSDRIAVMQLGQIVEMGPRDAVLRSPAHAYTRQLLSAVPAAHPSLRRTADMKPRIMESPVFAPGEIRKTGRLQEITPGHFVRQIP